MGKVIKVKNVKIGEGMPKICAPIVGETFEEIIGEAEFLKGIGLDIVEWRADYYQDATNLEKVKKILHSIRKTLADKPIIFTFRSSKEGGAKKVSEEFYFELNRSIIETMFVDIIDIELFNDEKEIKNIVDIAHKNGVSVIVSNHDLKRTPSKEEIISRLKKAIQLGCDIPKIAVMPNCARDVITLLDAACTIKEEFDIPIIAISMSGKGVLSRISGELFGSAITFGSGKKASAPGQIPVGDLRKTIQLLHDNM